MMLRKLVVLLATVGMLSMLAGSASAGFFIPNTSEIRVNLGALPTVVVTGKWSLGGYATLANNGTAHDLSDTASIWKDAGVSVGTSLLTGVALITRLTLTETNLSGSFTASFSTPNPIGGNQTAPTSTTFSGTICPGGCLGGVEPLNGQFIVGLAGIGPLPFPLSIVGVGGQATLPIGPGASIVATGAPFFTGKVRITNITTNLISIPDRGAGVTGVGITLAPAGTEEVKTFTTGLGFITDHPGATNLETRATVTISGTNGITSASGNGTVTLISPLRIQTGPLGVGNIPGKFSKQFIFVPEPGTVLLLVSGAAGLIFIGRKRMKG